MRKMLPIHLLLALAVALSFFECDAKFGESGEAGPRRRRCLNGSPPKRVRKRDRKLALELSGGLCRGLYPRLSCCSRRLLGQPEVFSVTNDTECVKLLEEIKCAYCSPHAQSLFRSPEKGEAPEAELVLPTLCKDYCKAFYYACRGHIPDAAECQQRNSLKGGVEG